MKKITFYSTIIIAAGLIVPVSASANSHVTVAPGDNLYRIALNNKTTVNALKEMNGLTSDLLKVGQKLIVSKEAVSQNNKNEQITRVSGIFQQPGKGYMGAIAPQRVLVLERGADGWLKIDTWKGDLWVKDGVMNEVAAPPALVNPPAVKGKTHIVSSGETLYRLSITYKTTVAQIKKDNNLKSDILYIGQKLAIGGTVETAPAPTPTPTPKPEESVTSKVIYTVVRGDNLTKISQKYGTTVNELMKLNKLNSTVIHIGQKLTIPEVGIQEPPVAITPIFMRPVETTNITSSFGPRWGSFHYGTDYAEAGNQKIMAAAAGVVTRSYFQSGFGEAVMVKHIIDGKVYETVYAHLREGSRAVKEGDQVQAGQFLGWMGSTGNSTGQHLHFEVHPGGYRGSQSAVDPALYVR